MSLLAKLMLAAGLFIALSGAGYLVHDSIYDGGYLAGEAKVRKEIEDARAEAGRLNKAIVTGDQELIVAKAIDKEKIVTIYRTIREQVQAQIIEVPVYLSAECHVPADGLRLIAAAAAGTVRADPAGSARDPAPAAAHPGK